MIDYEILFFATFAFILIYSVSGLVIDFFKNFEDQNKDKILKLKEEKILLDIQVKNLEKSVKELDPKKSNEVISFQIEVDNKNRILKSKFLSYENTKLVDYTNELKKNLADKCIAEIASNTEESTNNSIDKCIKAIKISFK